MFYKRQNVQWNVADEGALNQGVRLLPYFDITYHQTATIYPAVGICQFTNNRNF